MNLQKVQLSEDEIKLQQNYAKWFEEQQEHLYDCQEDRRPAHYANFKEAYKHIDDLAKQIKARKLDQIAKSQKNSQDDKSLPELDEIELKPREIIKVLKRAKVGITAIVEEDKSSSKDHDDILNEDSSEYVVALAFYDYNRKRYTYSTSILNDYITKINQVASTKGDFERILRTLESEAVRGEFAIYNPPGSHQIAVKNGIYNLITGKLEDNSPEKTVTSFIDTRYVKDAKQPKYYNRSDFELHDFLLHFCNYNESRYKLLLQIFKSCLLESKRADAFFVILGEGGEGKSTILDFYSAMIGEKSNTARISFDKINDDNQLLTAVGKKLLLGPDNHKVYVKDTSKLKSMASKEAITINRKYLDPIKVPFTASIVQLCNEMPRFDASSTSQWLKRRLVVLKAENSLTASDKDDVSIPSLLNTKAMHEYFLKYLLDDVPYYSGFETVDAEVGMNAISDDDLVGQFCEFLYDEHIISEFNTKLPSTTLYHIYLWWMRQYNPQSSCLAQQNFKKNMSSHLENYGYQYNQSQKAVSTLNNNKEFNLKLVDDCVETDQRLDQALHQLLENHSKSLSTKQRYFELTDYSILHNSDSRSRVQHKIIKPTTAVDYLGITLDVVNQGVENGFYDCISDGIFKRSNKVKQSTNLSNKDTLSSVFRTQSIEKLNQIKGNFEAGLYSSSELSYLEEEAYIIASIDQASNPTLKTLVDDHLNESNDDFLLDFIEQYKESLNK